MAPSSRAPQATREMGSFKLRAGDDHNATEIIGSPQALAALQGKVRAAIADAELPKAGTGRGRQAGSTNWSKERFWRKYAEAARGLERPYLPTHLAALMILNYATFCKYLVLWGPPAGFRAPRD